MAQYYADIQGNRGIATRMGTKKSGIEGHIRGWSVGAKVYMSYNEDTQEDECTVYLTSGSNGSSSSKLLGIFTTESLQTLVGD